MDGKEQLAQCLECLGHKVVWVPFDEDGIDGYYSICSYCEGKGEILVEEEEEDEDSY
jgi:hypothetical protein